jgi:hypothetical protein
MKIATIIVASTSDCSLEIVAHGVDPRRTSPGRPTLENDRHKANDTSGTTVATTVATPTIGC